MKWLDAGPSITDEHVDRFERQFGIRIPGSLRWFLMNVVNGGSPKGLFYVPVHGCQYQRATEVMALYGIDHPEPAYNFARAIEGMEIFGSHRGLPIGFDGGGGPLLLVYDGPRIGQVRHLIQDESYDPDYDTGLVAKDMHEFAKLLSGPSAEL